MSRVPLWLTGGRAIEVREATAAHRQGKRQLFFQTVMLVDWHCCFSASRGDAPNVSEELFLQIQALEWKRKRRQMVYSCNGRRKTLS
jgi:hypothetical protein